MTVRLFALIALLASSQAGFAIPRLAKPGCNESSYERGLRELIHKVGVVDTDGRVALSELTKRGEITQAEEEVLKKAVGSVHCRVNGKDPNGVEQTGWKVASAVIVGGGGPSKTLLTVAHAFFWPNSNVPLTGLSSCYFQDRAGSPRVSLDLEDTDLRNPTELSQPEGRFILGTNTPAAQRNRDRAVVRLKSAVNVSLPISRSGEGLGLNQRLLNVSAPHLDLVRAKKFDFNRDIVGQICSTRAIQSNGVITDCSSSGLASGSPLIVRNRNNRLVVAGLLAEEVTPANHDRTAFNINNNHTVAAPIDADYANDIAAVSGSTRMSTASVSN